MIKYIIGYWTDGLRNPNSKFYPLGICAKERNNAEIRIIDLKEFCQRFQIKDPITTVVFGNLEELFSDAERTSEQTNLHFKEIRIELEGTLREQADKLFRDKVLSFYK